ncbi:unnamed protein product [Didymodactylos carnosus]|uniref:Uncharacterized protein n=1 Tax=Didymodactylos carnosus TaxID=1234261 RepID=A0A8S2K8V5_9BILA|nr:unnamed protein product [Didymodactylos carnosus]CAF3843283.1 unnamed protein product [Didymodactylos carnosus]
MLSTQHVSLLPSKSELSKDFIVICLHVNLPGEMNFENADEYVDYIREIKTEKVLFVILSSESWIIELVYQLSQIFAIYISNINETKYEH